MVGDQSPESSQSKRTLRRSSQDHSSPGPEPGHSPEDMSHPYATWEHTETSPIPAFPRDTHQLPVLQPHHLGGWKAVCVTLQRQRLPSQSGHIGHAPLFPDAGGHLGSKEKQKRVPLCPGLSARTGHPYPAPSPVLRPVISLSQHPRRPTYFHLCWSLI